MFPTAKVELPLFGQGKQEIVSGEDEELVAGMEGDASSGITSAVQYDVFVSFRGADSRKGFVDYLYYHLEDAAIGIRIFRDEEMLPGQFIGEEIERAIRSSKICIPIFTSGYAASKWCLRELAFMVKNRRSGDKPILPIFYDVRPEDVSLKTRSAYRDALLIHEKHVGPEEVREWKDALLTVASIKGWEVRYIEDGEFWKSFTSEVLRLLVRIKHEDVAGPFDSAADYQVYLSGSEGENTARGLSDSLYSSMKRDRIRVFRHEKEPQGDATKWEKFLHNSNIFIPVFSKAYASSAQCLTELTLAAEHRRKRIHKEILPVFEDVESADVKLETGTYLNALIDQTGVYGAQKVREWMGAMKEVALIKLGRKLVNQSHEKFCRSVVEEVSNKLRKIKSVDVPEHLGGLAIEVEVAMRELNIESGDVRYLVIHGKSGTGKTTLAELLFDQLSEHFEVCTFLANIRESSERYGLEYLKNQICRSTPNLDKVEDDERKTIRERFRDKKVLIVLDDVDTSKQLKKLAGKSCWFGAGSRIILTTRNEGVAPEHLRLIRPHEMKEMDPKAARQLLCHHAFGRDSPPDDYPDINPTEIVSALQHRPLAIEVIGCFLHDKSKNVWQDMETNFHKLPHEEVLDKIMIVYEALNDAQKEIFLDIACLFVNIGKSNAVYMWEACDFSPNQEIEALVSMSLIKLIDNDKLQMHDMLIDLGRNIVREEKDLGKRSRLWMYEEVVDVLNRKKGTDKVKALRLCNSDSGEKCTFGRQAFAKLKCLRFLELSGMNLDGDFEDLLPMLRWLSWHDCPSEFKAKKLCLKKLVILDLSRSQIDENWVGWDEIQMLNNLKVLDLTGCRRLTTTPDLSRYPMLERLILEGCEKLTKIHSTTGMLKHLQYLNVKGCVSLMELPKEFHTLSGLTEIIAAGGSFQLPQSLNNLNSLLILELVGVKIAEIPRSIGALSRLERMSLPGCSMVSLLPASLGDLRSLIELDISDTQISELPSSIGSMKKLEKLNARKIKCLQKIPREIGEMCSLKILDLSGTSISILPDTVCKLSLLQSLNLDSCDNLHELPELPKSLTRLRIKSQSLKRIPDLSNLNNLKDLLLCMSPNNSPSSFEHPCALPWIPMLPKLVNLELRLPNLTTLPETFASLSHLRSLHLACPDLGVCPKLPYSLWNFALVHIKPKMKLPDLFNLKHLSSLKVDDCTIGDDWVGSLKIRDLEFLENLTVSKCNFTKLSGSDLPKCLKSLFVTKCDGLKTLPDLSGLGNLEHLELSDCKSLIDISGLGGVETLRELIICNCSSLKSFGDLSSLRKLKVVQLDNCDKLQDVQGLDKLESVKYMRIYA